MSSNTPRTGSMRPKRIRQTRHTASTTRMIHRHGIAIFWSGSKLIKTARVSQIAGESAAYLAHAK